GRLANPADKSSGMFEKVVLRTFCVYVIARMAAAPVMPLDRNQWLGWIDAIVPALMYIDYAMLALPVILLEREFPQLSRAAAGPFVYLSSVCLLYTSILVSVHIEQKFGPIQAGLLLSLAIFHSTEYLAIVTWSVKKRHAKSKEGFFAYVVPRWG